MLTEYDIAEVNFIFLDTDESLFAGANEGDVDLSCFTQDGEEGVYIFVQLRGECYGDCGGETC